MARARTEEERRRKRLRWARGLALAGTVVGVPLLLNTLVARSARRLPASRWGRPESLDTPLGALAYRRLGDGSPVVLVHAFGPGYEGGQWRAVAEALAGTHTVFVPDLLGWGASAKPASGQRAATQVALLERFLREAVGEPAVLVAAGLPAAYAIELAANAPELVRALALVAPLGLLEPPREELGGDQVLHALLRFPVFGTSALNVYASRSAIEHHFAHDVFANAHLVTPELIDEHYRASHLPGAQRALAAYLSGRLHLSITAVIPRLALPVWLGWGRESVAPPVEDADLWLHALPAAELEVFDGAGSLPHLESPAAVTEALEDFLASLPETDD